MTRRKALWKMPVTMAAFGLALALVLSGCPTDAGESTDPTDPGGSGTPGNITWNAVANDAATTTAINFGFQTAVTGLTAGDITIAPGTGSATRGALIGSGTSWSLAITTTSPGTLYVSINRAGIASGPQQVEVFQGGPVIPAEIIGRWHHDGLGTFMYEFTADGRFIPAAGYIGHGISVSGNTISVSLDGDIVGTADFEVDGEQMTLSNTMGAVGFVPGLHVRHDITFTATVNNATFTTAINFGFSHPVSGLTPAHITVTNLTGVVTRGDLTSGGTSWSLEVAVATAGDVIVFIDKPGVDGTVVQVEVGNTITWVASPNRTTSTTAIDFVFVAPIEGLTAWDITLAQGNVATPTMGALTGGGTEWSLEITVTNFNRGFISVSIDMPGVESGPRSVWIYPQPIVNVSASGHTVAIMEDGTLWAWGPNWYGQIGDGTTTTRHSPVRIGTDNNWLYVSAGGSHTVGIRKDGSLWAWGRKYDPEGGWGDPPFIEYGNSPVRIGTNNNWVTVSAGSRHTVAIREDGSLWAWGVGLLGDGTAISRNSPVRVGADNNWLYVSAGENHTMAIREDGSLWAWGNNWSGQLGDGTTTSHNSPVQIGTDNNWLYVSAGSSHTAAIREDGSLWVWGFNHYGQVGDGTTTTRHSPVRIDLPWATSSTSVSAGNQFTIAIDSNGIEWDWGNNQWGQGSNTHHPRSLARGRWIAVSAGHSHGMGIMVDGSLWAWGNNQWGQLGDGTTINRPSNMNVRVGGP